MIYDGFGRWQSTVFKFAWPSGWIMFSVWD